MQFSIFPLYCILFNLGRHPRLFRGIRRIVVDYVEGKYYINIQSEMEFRGVTYLVQINFTATESEVRYELFEEVIPEELRIEIRGLLDYLAKEYTVCMRTVRARLV